MMKRMILVGLVLCLLGFGLSANPLARIYQVDDPLWQSIEELSWESGINPFVASGPISGYELNRHVRKIDPGNLSDRGKLLLQEVIEYLNDPYQGKMFDYSITAALEGYTNINDTFNYYEWEEGYVDRTPPLALEVETIFGQGAYGVFSYALPKAFDVKDFTGFTTNLPDWFGVGNSAFQNSVPHTAFLGFSNEWLTMIAGRDAIRLGRGYSGNLMVDDNGPYNDFFTLSVANKSLKYTFLAIPMNELVTQELKDRLKYNGTIGEGYYPKSSDNPSWRTLFHGTRRRTYIAHRLSLDITPAWRIALTEGVLYYLDAYDLRMLSPLMLQHNLQNFGEVNNSIGLESELTLSRNWSLNIQVFLDQLQTKGEQDTGGGKLPPNAYAFLLGGRFSYPMNDWKVSGYVEGVYASPWVYLRTGDETENYGGDNNKQYNLDLVNVVTMYDGKSGVSWLGYSDGPDSIVFNSRLEAVYQDRFSMFGHVKAKASGQYGMKIWGKTQKVDLQLPQDINLPSPTGDPTYTLTLGLGVGVKFFDTNLELGVRNYLVNEWTLGDHRTDNQLVFGISYTF